MKFLPLVLMAVCISQTAVAQENGFKDFEVAPDFASSNPMYLTEFDGKLYFYADDGTSGREPFYIQGSNNPQIIKNLNAGSKNAIDVSYNKPSAGMNGKFYFTADNGASGEELFMWDGTNPPGLVFDPNFGPDSSSPDNYLVYNNVLYYTATTAAEGTELWEYTGSGTPKRITDVNAGTGNGVAGPMAVLKGKIYFIGNDGTNGNELWAYNTLSQTASMAADIESGATSSDPANLTVINDKLYFTANTFLKGREMYEYDGNNPPTRLTDISTDALSSFSPVRSNAFALFNGKIYFAGRDVQAESHLYSYDPTNGNVNLEYKINPNGDSRPRDLVIYNNQLYFAANDGANGLELYTYDGNNKPALVGDLCAGTNSSIPQELTPIGDELYFYANNCSTSGVDIFSYNHKRVGIKNVLFDAQVDIYPNPVQRNLHIDLDLKQPEKLEVRLADTNGKNIYSEGMRLYSRGKNKTDIPMRNLPAGNYIYYITNEQGTTYLTGKVVKQD